MYVSIFVLYMLPKTKADLVFKWRLGWGYTYLKQWDLKRSGRSRPSPVLVLEPQPPVPAPDWYYPFDWDVTLVSGCAHAMGTRKACAKLQLVASSLWIYTVLYIYRTHVIQGILNKGPLYPYTNMSTISIIYHTFLYIIYLRIT